WPDFTLFTASSLNSAVYSCFGIFIAFLSSVIVILRHHWKTIFRGKVKAPGEDPVLLDQAFAQLKYVLHTILCH
ncbi:MAG TPA: hypothetical protein VNL74_13560, partial [Methylococcus sp.]|nr:hypothetical protein [Methylococcus sp.]